MDTQKLNLTLAPVNLSSTVREIVQQFDLQFSEARCQIQLELEENVVGYLDKSRFEQILINLLSNAIKYAPGAPISVFLKKNSSQAILIVQDGGPGIAHEMHARVFERFFGAHTSGSAGGLGLGLYITKEIVRAHQGLIHVENNKGVGARFTVTLPLNANSAS